ncbi:hypothetical protein WBG99_07750 [Streptomyces sp. TG1A-60]|uniref:hypothetical protein n=1 Tax=Streptomyces sp. TG1A-60 TaxID=3129111 RepID=UPI0030CE0C07
MSASRVLRRLGRSPKALADLAHGTIDASHSTLAEALTGRFEEHHAFMCRMLPDTVDHLTARTAGVTAATRCSVEQSASPLQRLVPSRRA